MNLVASHILSIEQFQREGIEQVFSVADSMEPYALRKKKTRVLEGAILSNMFFEASTRTRLSFGSAFNLLGGQVRETVGLESSSISKGESLTDTARVISGYSDIICMRHPQPFAVAEFARHSRVPVINGGDGSNEHPTQALLDLYTIRKELQTQGLGIDGIKIAMIGDLKHGRTVHSLCLLLAHFSNVQLCLVSPKELQLPSALIDILKQRGIKVTLYDDLQQGISNVQIIYSTRIQQERFSSNDEADLYRGKFRLNRGIYTKACQPNTVIMHPLPRDSRKEANELDADLDDSPHLAIFRQADNGVLVRMALFALILDVTHLVQKYDEEVVWHSTK